MAGLLYFQIENMHIPTVYLIGINHRNKSTGILDVNIISDTDSCAL